MSFTPIVAKVGITEYTLSRVDSDQLKLACVADDNPELTISIVFPQSMVLELCQRAIRRSMRLTADQVAARVFPQLFMSEPVWPTDPFDESE